MKRQSTDWKNIFANDATNNNLISKIYKQLIQFNNNSKKLPDNPVENWANRHFYHLSHQGSHLKVYSY